MSVQSIEQDVNKINSISIEEETLLLDNTEIKLNKTFAFGLPLKTLIWCFITFFSVIIFEMSMFFSWSLYAVSIPSMVNDTQIDFDFDQSGYIIGASIGFYSLSKLVSGFITDYIGPKFMGMFLYYIN